MFCIVITDCITLTLVVLLSITQIDDFALAFVLENTT